MISKINTGTCFENLPPSIMRKILGEGGNPAVRKVSKLLKLQFDAYCYNAWITMENDKSAPEELRNRLTVFRTEFQKNHSNQADMKNNGFFLISSFLQVSDKSVPVKNLGIIPRRIKIEFNMLRETVHLAWRVLELLELLNVAGHCKPSIFNEVIKIKSTEQFTGLRQKAFGWLKNYKSDNLHVRSNLTVLPSAISLLNVKKLSLTGNKLTKLPESISQMPNLESLDIAENNFSQFPTPLYSCEKLNYVRLSFNKLEKIPKEICQIKRLQTLDLSDNWIVDVPEEICRLEKLAYLGLNYNRLTKLPPEIVYLKKLITIRLNDNNPQSIQPIMRIPVIPDIWGKKESQKSLEENLSLFFDFTPLKIAAAYGASRPLAKFCQALIFQHTKNQALNPLITALSTDDRNLFYKMFVTASTIFDESFTSPETEEGQLQWAEDHWHKAIPQVLDWAVKETIAQKYRELDIDAKSKVHEWIKSLPKTKDIRDPSHFELATLINKVPLQLADAMDLAETMEVPSGFCVLN